MSKVAAVVAAVTMAACMPAVGTARAETVETEPSDCGHDCATVTLFGVTDFHGHIENGRYLATALKETRSGNPNTLFVGAGDLVGASAYASSIQDDMPAIDQLKQMGLAVSATGNHEFDQGADDLVDRIIPQIAPGRYVVANVTGGALDGKVEPYAIETIGGKRIAFIGGVFEGLLGAVSPAGMSGISVTDPVAAINKYADRLSDGDESNGEADAVVALVHGDADGLTGLDANVDAAFAGHTHLKKQTVTASGAPVLQAANYGTAFATVDLSISGTGGAAHVVARNAAVNDVFADDGDPLYAADPDAQAIYDEANAYAEQYGIRQVGTVAAGSVFNRGSDTVGDANGNGNNRGVESTLGDLQGDVALWAANDTLGEGSADIGVINPGGLRADLDPNGDGIITNQEAHDVLPFGNTNAVVTLTGAQLTTLFEQQWQDGVQPAGSWTPVLWLGVSSNVTYKYETYDATVDGRIVQRGRVFDLKVNGLPVRDDATYKVAGNAFLLAGGDNFTVFQDGTGYVDTGFTDIDGFAAYLSAHPSISANRSRLSSGFSNVALDGDVLSFDVTGLAYTSDEVKPKAIDLHVNGVDFGVIEGVVNDNYQGVNNGPDAGWVHVEKTVTAEQKKKLLSADGLSPDFFSADVVSLFTDEEIQSAKDSRVSGGESESGDVQGGAQDEGNRPTDAGARRGVDTLPDTGADVSSLAAVALLLLGAGVEVRAIRRRD